MNCSPRPYRIVRRIDPAGRASPLFDPPVFDCPVFDRPVFDRTRPGAWAPPDRGRFAADGGAPRFSCRNTDRDRKPPRSVVTAQLMGDPPANRQR